MPFEYTVNVIVDNSDTQGAPVLVENTPTYKNLFGAIDRVVDPLGRVVSNFSRIRAGSVLRANGGYVLFNLEDALTEPFVWKTLKRVLQSQQIKVEAYDTFAMFTVSALQPEAIPMQTKVVVTGSPWLYYLLYFNDPDFAHIFKIKADFGDEMARTDEHEISYARLIARLCYEEDLTHFDPSGVTAAIEEGMRRAGDQEKLASQFDRLADVVREASYVAQQEGATAVGYAHVDQALQAQRFRANRLEELLRDRIAEGALLIETDGYRVGQINGLSVLQLGDYTFGRSSRVTATTAMGRTITHIDQGLALLTGVSAGDPETPHTLHYRVNTRLRQLAQELTAFDGREHSQNGRSPEAPTRDG